MKFSVLLALLLFIGMASATVGLVGYWKFDENTGISLNDSSGSGNTGTRMNAANWTTGKNYQTPYALSFDGVNQYVNISANTSLNFTSNLTVSAWIYPANFPSGLRIIQKTGYDFILYASSANIVRAYITNNASNVITATATTPCPTGAWCHVAMTFGQNDSLKIYINGVISATTPTTDNNTLQSISTDVISIGRDTAGASYFNGTIDEVKIWNRTLSAAEILNESFHYCPLNPIGITTWNESNTAQTEIFSFTASNTTSSFSYTTTASSNSFIDYYCNSSFPLGSVEVSISNSSAYYSPRYYYPTLAYGGSYSLNAYLLPLTDMDYIQTTILIKNQLGNTVPGAIVTIQKMIDGAYATIAQDTVDGVGQVFFTLDKNTNYYLIASATGYDTTTMNFQPSQIQYTVTLFGNVNYNFWDNSTSNIYWNVTPGSYRLTGLQNFNFSILDANNSLEFWGMSINYNGTQLYFSNQTASAGGSVNRSINTSNYPGNINMTIFFKRVNGTFFDPKYPYFGYSIVANNNSLVNAMANVGSSDLDPLTKSLLALLVITLVVGYVGSQNFTGGVLLAVVMMWGFASFGFLDSIIVSMLTVIGLGIIILKYLPTG